jgi:hypothetical protein
MNQSMEISTGERLVHGIIASTAAVFFVLLLEAADFYGGIGWAGAESLAEYFAKGWFLPAGAAVLFFLIGFWKGCAAWELLQELWFWRD